MHFDEEGNSDNIHYVFANGERVAKIYENGSKIYYLNDHLGSSTVLVNENGEVVDRIKYRPFGAVRLGDNVSKYGYNNKEKDSTGLLYYGARYYNPKLRRWTQPDTLLPNVYDPQSLNRYSYVLNNPMKYEDEEGHQAQWMLEHPGETVAGGVILLQIRSAVRIGLFSTIEILTGNRDNSRKECIDENTQRYLRQTSSFDTILFDPPTNEVNKMGFIKIATFPCDLIPESNSKINTQIPESSTQIDADLDPTTTQEPNKEDNNNQDKPYFGADEQKSYWDFQQTYQQEEMTVLSPYISSTNPNSEDIERTRASLGSLGLRHWGYTVSGDDEE